MGTKTFTNRNSRKLEKILYEIFNVVKSLLHCLLVHYSLAFAALFAADSLLGPRAQCAAAAYPCARSVQRLAETAFASARPALHRPADCALSANFFFPLRLLLP